MFKLGDLSKEYESGDLGPGCISHTEGDSGGASYGVYQFATNAGIPHVFVAWLHTIGNPWGDRLAPYSPGTDEFDAEWTNIANEDPDGFYEVQHEYARLMYYVPAMKEAAKANIDMTKHTFALQNVVWSASIQYSPYYIQDLFEDACEIIGWPNPSYGDAKEFDEKWINAIYQVRASDDWTSRSPSLRPGLRARFESECQKALELLKSEQA